MSGEEARTNPYRSWAESVFVDRDTAEIERGSLSRDQLAALFSVLVEEMHDLSSVVASFEEQIEILREEVDGFRRSTQRATE